MTQELIEKTISSIEIFNKLKPGDFNEAHEFLMKVHESDVAWTIADQLIKKQKDPYTSYFGAETMKNKIQKHFEELPVESHLSLKDSILENLQNTAITSNYTLSNQLCISVADIYCHMVAWKDGISEIIGTFSTKLEYIPILLDILRYLPEEQTNKALKLGVNRKKDLYADMEKNKTSVMLILDKSISLSDSTMLTKAILCLASWYDGKLLIDMDLQQSALCRTVLEIVTKPMEITDENLFKSAINCIQTFLHQTIEKIPTYLLEILKILPTVEKAYLDCEIHRQNYCIEYTKIFCDLTYNLLPFILDSPKFDDKCTRHNVRTLNLMVLAARTNVECCTEIILVMTDYFENNSLYCDDTTALSPLFEQLISEIAKYCTITKHDGDVDDLCVFRQDVFFLMENLRFLINIDVMYMQMLNCLQGLLNQNQLVDAEALLYLVSSLIKFVDYSNPEIDQWTEQLLTGIILPNIRQAHVTFKDVAFTMFGELTSWFIIPSHKHLLIQAMREVQFFIDELHTIPITNFDKATRTTLNGALLSLSSLLKRDPFFIISDNDVLNLVIEIFSSITRLNCVPGETIYLYECFGRMLYLLITKSIDSSLYHNFQKITYEVFLMNWIRLQQIPLDINARSIGRRSTKTSQDPCVWIDNLAAIYSSLIGVTKDTSVDDQAMLHIQAEIVQTLNWPRIVDILSKYSNQGRVLERIVRIIRYMVRSLKQLLLPLVAEMADTIVRYYTNSFESAFLYLGGILVDEYSEQDRDIDTGLVQMYFALCPSITHVLWSVGLDQNPNTAEDFFRLTLRLFEHLNSYFCGYPSFDLISLLQLTLRGIRCSNLDTCELAVRLLSVIMDQSIKSMLIIGSQMGAWLVNRVDETSKSGLAELLSVFIDLCKTKSEDLLLNKGILDDFDSIINNAKMIVESTYMNECLDFVLNNAGLTRKDGLVYVTEEQLNEFKDRILSTDKPTKGKRNNFEIFSRLFV